MKAMILAAGRGERLRPLTDTLPKPLIKAGGKSLIEYHLDKLATAGFKDVVINTAWLAEEIHRALGDGGRYGLGIQYSDEGTALETAGGIIHALPLLGDEPFLVINGDIWTDFDFATIRPLAADSLAHLVLVDNPAHHPDGDFSLVDGYLQNSGRPAFTFSGIGLYAPAFFHRASQGIKPLAPMLREAADRGRITAQHYTGAWTDVGTIERLQQLEQNLKN